MADLTTMSSEMLAHRIAVADAEARARRIELAELENVLAELRAEDRRRLFRPVRPRA